MSIKRCVLCDGRVVNNRCMECGMDFSRWETRYRLNEDGSFEKVNKGQAAQRTNMAQRNTHTANRPQQRMYVSDDEKRRREKAVKDARAKRMTVAANQKTRREYGADKPKKKVGKIAVLIFIIGLVVDIAGTVFDNFSFGTREVEVSEEPLVEYEEIDPYAYVVDEMPEEGVRFETKLGKGSYYGGEQLPVGSYTVTLINDDGYGNIGLYDDKNLIYYLEYLDYADVTVLEDVRLYEGTQIEIEGNIKVQLESENAQVESLKLPQENPLEFSVVMTEKMVCGEDFEPGMYDLHVAGGYGTVTRTQAESDYYDWYTWLNVEDEEEAIYVNKEFVEGDILAFDDYSSEDFAVELIPSAEIYP